MFVALYSCVTVVSRAECRLVDIHTWVERKRMATVTSSCLQRQEAVGISLFSLYIFFFVQGTLNKYNYHVHTDRTVQQIKQVSSSPTMPKQMKSAWPPESSEQERLWLQECCKLWYYPRGERMLTHWGGFFFLHEPAPGKQGGWRYCTAFPELIGISWNCLFLEGWQYAFVG